MRQFSSVHSGKHLRLSGPLGQNCRTENHDEAEWLGTYSGPGLGIIVADGVTCYDAVQLFGFAIVPVVAAGPLECARIASKEDIVCDWRGGSIGENIILIAPYFILSRAFYINPFQP